MMKLKFVTLFLCILLSVTTIPLSSSATITYYPGTNIIISPGDVLYTTAGFDTAMVGHVAIVGDDYKIYHSTAASDAVNGIAVDNSITNYMNRFNYGQLIHVYRYGPTGQYGPFIEPVNAGKWARLNYTKVKSYSITVSKMSDFSKDYCSKFMWQVWYYGANVKIDKPYLGNYMTPDSTTIFAPSDINFSQGANASIFVSMGTVST